MIEFARMTPEEFLDPQIGNSLLQGRLHFLAVHFLFETLTRWFLSRPDVAVLSDLKHLMGPRRGPAPDISILMGVPDLAPDIESYDLRTGGIPPSLIIEVVSPSDSRIRRTDEVTKVKLYERLGVREYLLLDLPRRGNRRRLTWRGYRLDGGLDRTGRYERIEPDLRGRIHSKTAGLLFGADPTESWIEITDAGTGKRLRTSLEEEQRAEQEAKARKEAEAEIARLREELARLRGEA
jgi:Uma2 family endonuclease